MHSRDKIKFVFVNVFFINNSATSLAEHICFSGNPRPRALSPIYFAQLANKFMNDDSTSAQVSQ